MGIFSLFKKKNAPSDSASVMIGYLRMQTSELIGHPVDSKAFRHACNSSVEPIQTLMLPLLKAEKDSLQAVHDILSKHCGYRKAEAFGEYLTLLWARYSVIQVAISQGRVKAEEATLKIICEALLRQIERAAPALKG